MPLLNCIKLTREEVQVLLELIGLPSMPGVRLLSSYSENEEIRDLASENEEVRDLALRVLISRGVVVSHDENEYVVDEKVAEIVTLCIASDVMPVIELSIATEFIVTSFPITLKPGLFVVHQAIKDMHTFEIYDDVRDIAEQAVRSLRIRHQIPELSLVPFKMNAQTMYEADSVRDQGVPAILQIMQQDGNDIVTKQYFAEVLAHCEYHAMFYVLRRLSDEMDSFTVIASKDICFIITSSQELDTVLMIQTISTEEICRRVHSICLTLL